MSSTSRINIGSDAAAAPLSNSTSFCAFLEDIACLGVVPSVAAADEIAFGVFRARSNDRYWLLPLMPRGATRAGFGMLQPVSRFANVAKRAALLATGLRIDAFWARHRLYLSDLPALPVEFPEALGAVSYFTGTDGPHRKTTIQFMTRSGTIMGYGKLTRNAEIARYMSVEAKALEKVGKMNIKSAGIPRLLGEGVADGANWIVTNSRRGKTTKVRTGLKSMHVAFLRELAERTKCSYETETLAVTLTQSAAWADTEWSQRFLRTRSLLGCWEDDIEASFVHGDFTPWNCFIDASGLYVFDWEYSREMAPVGFDLVQFLLSCPSHKPPSDENAKVVEHLAEIHFGGSLQRAKRHYLLALITHASFYQDRQIRVGAAACGWIGADRYARLVDAILRDERLEA